MTERETERVRQVLFEAFTAGWQAALAVRITNPRVLAVVETCFDLWLEEAADQAEVLGFAFRRRGNLSGKLPGRVRRHLVASSV